MKRMLAALTLTITAIFGGFAAPAMAQPVQATAASDITPMDYGTYVFFGSCSTYTGGPTDDCSNWHIRVWTMNGAHNFLLFMGTARNVRDVCPASSNYRLGYTRPNGTTHRLAMGDCQDMRWADQGTYKFSMSNY